jgi:predicted CxxxxCH...CXXCH cytochrome family protein
MNMDINQVAVKQAAVKRQTLLVIAVMTIMMLWAVAAHATKYPILHNSSTANSKNYWTAPIGWGVSATSAYGRFTCQTCHSPSSTLTKNNIMRIRSSITLPTAGGATGFNRKVVYTNRTGVNSFGNDSVTYSTTHTNVCEACHTLTTVHRYNTNNGVINHMASSRQDCTGCHPHSAGFKASGCNGCHGVPPLDATIGTSSGLATPMTGYSSPGAHQQHNVDMAMACATCHNNTIMANIDNKLHIQFKINNSNYSKFSVAAGTAPFGSFSGKTLRAPFTGYSSGATKRGYRADKDLTCNTYCHASWANNGGSKSNPRWDVAADGACGTCHYVTNAAVAASAAPGSHSKHANNTGSNYGIKCAACHNVTVNTKNHVQGLAYVVFDNLSATQVGTGAATYRGSAATTSPGVASAGLAATAANYGRCNNLYCHSNGQSKGGVGILYRNTPSWGSGAIGCDSCHNNMATFANASSGDHVKHAQSGGVNYGFKCNRCHGPGYSATAVDTTTHVNKNINLQFMSSATGTVYTKGTAYAPGSAYSTCSASYCHSNGQSDNAKPAIKRVTPTWGGASSTHCGSCHNNMATFANASSGSHYAHANTSANAKYDCGVCHAGATATTPNYATHVNKEINLNGTILLAGYSKYSAAGFNPGKGYYGTCSVTSCHGSGKPTWGATSVAPVNGFPYSANLCEKCHGSSASNPFYSTAIPKVTVNTDAKVGGHFNHLSSNSKRISHSATCGDCHDVPATVTAATHLTGSAAPSFPLGGLARGLTGTVFATYSAATGSCATTYCHGDGLPKKSNALATGPKKAAIINNPRWNQPFLSATVNTAPSLADCGACHGFPPRTAAHKAVVGYQPYTASQNIPIASAGCQACHKHMNANATFNDASLHINGKVEGGDCVGCHSSANNVRIGAAGQFTMQSHHVQGRALTTADCAACHREANTDGTENTNFHKQLPGGAVDLVVWNPTMNGVNNISTRDTGSATFITYTANGKRTSIGKINNHCLGCHSSPNAGFKPFNTYSTIKYSPEARLRTAKAKTSIQSRYSSTKVVAWSQYRYSSATGATSRFGTNNKYSIKKALSAHGKAQLNQMMAWDTSQGEERSMTAAAALDYTSANSKRNVFCYDCHNSHGSDAAGVTSSYNSATGNNMGGILKSTTIGLGGYAVTYKPAARTTSYKNYSVTTRTTATFNSGASLCNDCHNNDTRKVNINKPWSITSTYSSARAIGGYWSTPYFDNYTTNNVKRTTYKGGGGTKEGIKDYTKPMGGHFGSSINGVQAGHDFEVNGLCTTCHDPHGVSQALGADRDHGIPLLKGTWVTSPYREDKADKIVKRGGGSNFSGLPNMGAVPGYHIDQNTFMTTPAPVNLGAASATGKGNRRAQAFRSFSLNSSAQSGTGMPNLAPATFAGLCLECHSQTTLTGAATSTTSKAWQSKERVHQSVAGWASTNGTNVTNKVHSYTCAKCHTAHVSKLPRLLVTNCLDQRHFGQSVSSSINSIAASTTPGNIVQSVQTSSAYGAGRFPGGGSRYSNTPGSAQNPGGWWFQTNGATNASQPGSPQYGSLCHNAANAGGATYSPINQRWNKKSAW